MAPKLNENRVPSKCLPLFLVDLGPSLLLFISLSGGKSLLAACGGRWSMAWVGASIGGHKYNHEGVPRYLGTVTVPTNW